MPIAQNNPGVDGNFTWFMGRVVDRADPESLGRVRVRALGWHTDDVALLPNNALPWAIALYANNPSPQITPPKIGDWVMGFFQDGKMAQKPVILGVMPTQGGGGFADDLGDGGPAPLASRPSPGATMSPGPDGVGTVVENQPAVPSVGAGTPGATTGTPPAGIANASAAPLTGLPDGAGGTFDEPASTYASVYPLNKAQVSESGHSMEMDDSPGAERLDLRHRTGSGVEFQPSGDAVQKTMNNHYMMINGASFEGVSGGKTVSIGAGLNLQTSGGAGIIAMVDGGGGIDITVTGGNVKINVTGDIAITNSGKVDITSGGPMNLTAGGPMALKAPKIDLN